MQKPKAVTSIMILLVVASFISAPDANGYVDASCHLSVYIYPHPSKITVKGEVFARQNPDGTYYPGDAFDFGILVSWTKNCWHIYPKPIKASGLTLSAIQQGLVSYDEQGNGHYYEYGHAEIGTATTIATLSQVVTAFGLVCGLDKCYRGDTSGSGSYQPHIVKPQVTVALKFENFTDRDGYKMRNNDGTYYVWDGINIVFNPRYMWKDERFGTIDARTDSWSDISQIGKYECHQRRCPYTFSRSAIEPWGYNLEYEEGHTAYNCTLSDNAGRHVFSYHTTVYNLGRKIGEADNSTIALVVKYVPVYTNYPYTVLKDGSSWWGFGKSPAVALHYFGSIGGGPDDGVSVIHPDRRSKINSFAYDSFAYRILARIALNESMTWSESRPASFVDGEFAYHDAALQSGNGSAMFVRAGYGKIIFNHPILYTILRNRYDNSTIIGTLQSSNFAGYGVYNLTRYYFGYPHTRFSTDVIVIALHSDGSINHMPLSLKMEPDFSENATYEQDFIREKVIHDRDRIFAGMVLDDMYGKDNSAEGTGLINMRANLTSMAIPDIYRVFAGNPLDLPLNLIYEQPSPYNITIMAGHRQISFVERAFEFDTKWRYVINLDQDNALNGTREGGIITLYPDSYFGPYVKVLLDGKVQDVGCSRGCTLLLHNKHAGASVVAFNAWGGRASGNFAPQAEATSNTHDDSVLASVLAVLLMVCCYVILKYWREICVTLGLVS